MDRLLNRMRPAWQPAMDAWLDRRAGAAARHAHAIVALHPPRASRPSRAAPETKRLAMRHLMSPTRTVALVLGLCALPAAALAQQSPGREALKRACTGDYLEHCSEFPAGGPEVEACFRAKLKQLSAPCASAIAAYRQEQRSRRISDSR